MCNFLLRIETEAKKSIRIKNLDIICNPYHSALTSCNFSETVVSCPMTLYSWTFENKSLNQK